MGRYRAPRKPGSNYITPLGRRRLQEEFDELWRVKRPQVTQAVSEAAAQGDRSENAEYIYGKKQLREIDARLRFLSKRLENLKVVDRLPADCGRVFFGAWVTLEDEGGEQVEYRIVGPDEFDREPAYISMDSPTARALLKKQVGDEVQVRAPSGMVFYEIIHVRYEAP
ncbi:MAG: transcription elongation factor GreB [Pseudomonadales bacterium]|jgi:transcription elongation factor GreB